jgi:hypothetical protein
MKMNGKKITDGVPVMPEGGASWGTVFLSILLTVVGAIGLSLWSLRAEGYITPIRAGSIIHDLSANSGTLRPFVIGWVMTLAVSGFLCLLIVAAMGCPAGTFSTFSTTEEREKLKRSLFPDNKS